jgi:conjugative transposon TraN protein
MRKYILSLVALMATLPAMAQNYLANEKRVVYINENVTTFIISGENIKFMDLSASDTLVVGNQPAENVVRLKALKKMRDYEDVGMVTIIGERTMNQYKVRYTSNPSDATSEYRISPLEGTGYSNPDVDMTLGEMYRYGWKIFHSDRKFYDVANHQTGMEIRLNNIYTVGNYFFFDISMYNKTKIQFDIEELRVKLCDKRQSKATSTQDIELQPVMELKKIKKFKKTYRNIFVMKKLTFPDEKVLTFSFAEAPISGRTITLRIDYEDVLNADSFDKSLF